MRMILYDYRRKLEDEPLSAATALFNDYCAEQRIMQAKSEVICFVPSCYFALAAQYSPQMLLNGVLRTVSLNRRAPIQASFQQK